VGENVGTRVARVGNEQLASSRWTTGHTSKMAELIAIPLKKPSDVDVVKPLTNVIQSTYSSTGKDYADAIAEFSKLRNNALWRAFEKYESSLQVIYRYESSFSIIILIMRATDVTSSQTQSNGTSGVISLAHAFQITTSASPGIDIRPAIFDLSDLSTREIDKNERIISAFFRCTRTFLLALAKF